MSQGCWQIQNQSWGCHEGFGDLRPYSPSIRMSSWSQAFLTSFSLELALLGVTASMNWKRQMKTNDFVAFEKYLRLGCVLMGRIPVQGVLPISSLMVLLQLKMAIGVIHFLPDDRWRSKKKQFCCWTAWCSSGRAQKLERSRKSWWTVSSTGCALPCFV